MRAARFFIDAPLVPNSELELPSSVAHHASRVLRLRDGAPIVLFNGTGGEFAATFRSVGNATRATVGAHATIERESALAITLVQSWIAAEKLDWVIEKAVELGVHAVMLVPANRSVVHLNDARLAKRLAKLSELVLAACCQSGRNRLPRVSAAASLQRGLELSLSPSTIGVLLDPSADAALIADAEGATHCRYSVAVGPEGGFDESEVADAVRMGYCRYALGPRTLRTETAGLAAIAALQAVAGDLGASRESFDTA